MLHFITGTVSFDTAPDLRHIEAAARAFGEFQRQLGDLPGPPLRETIPAFHDTRRRFARFEEVLRTAPVNRRQSCEDEIHALQSLRHLATALQDLQLPLRTVHNDTKLNNLLFDQQSQEPLCVIDWDTVMPGHVAHDFGDMVRTMTSEAAEDEPDLSRVQLRPERLAALQSGYLSATRDWLAPAEVESLRLGAETILYEQALRFLTDHLEGSIYYPVSQPGHNLLRARVQLALLHQLRLLPPP
jgi:aminoglycoside phosphotransferase (APT) family kinase protein